MSRGKGGSSGFDKDATPVPIMETPKRVGRVFRYVATDRGLVPWATLQKDAIKKARAESRSASQQRELEANYMADRGLIPPPFNAAGLLTLMENCSFYDACLRQIGRDVAGQGWAVQPIDPEAEPNEVAKKMISDFLADPNTAEEAVDDIIERLVVDWGLVGMMAMEVVRAKVEAVPAPPEEGGGEVPEGESEPTPAVPVPGIVNGLYHVPAHTIRAHRDGNKFCSIVGNTYTWFKRFGYAKDVDVNTGDEREPGAAEMPGAKTFTPANEIIIYLNYYPQSKHYGAPSILPAVGSVKALIGIRDYNLSFFENYGVPAAIVTLEGEWDEESVKMLSDFIDVEIKGSNNAHKTLVINPPEGGKITWTPLVTEVKEGSFKLYFKQLRDEVLVCYRMPPYRIGIEETGSLGGNIASEATRIYIDSTVNPIKKVINRIFSQKIVRDGFGVKDLEFELGYLDIRDLGAILDRGIKMFGAGAKTRNEIRIDMGLEPIDAKVDPLADKYFIASSYKEIGAESAADAAAIQMAAVEEGITKLHADFREAVEKALKSGRVTMPVGDEG